MSPRVTDRSRRTFVNRSLAIAGAMTVGTLIPGNAAGRLAWFGSGKVSSTRRIEPGYLKLEREGVLAKRARVLWKIYEKCTLCPRKCEIKRLAGENKVCRATDKLRVHSAGAHRGEEKPLVGENGSGTIFFSHCNLRCCFCQNWEIAHRGDGSNISHAKLAEAMLGLQKRGCHNINLVTPTHMVPHIVRAVRIAANDGLRLPLVYNTGGYDKLETLRLLDGIVDIYMPDFKFQDGMVSARLCEKAEDYPLVAAAAIREMHRQVGELEVDDRGVARRGLIIRHLVMPGNLAGTDRFTRWVAEELSVDTYVNIMAQYRPEYKAREHEEIARSITSTEWRQAVSWAEKAGLKRLDL